MNPSEQEFEDRPSCFQRQVGACIMRLRRRAPYFSVLALHAPIHADPAVGTACTNGKWVRISPGFFDSLSPVHRDFLLAHEVLHMALRHCARAGMRDPLTWNVAADIVVNGMLVSGGLTPIPGGIRDSTLEHLRVEDVYARLGKLKSGRNQKLGGKVGERLRDLAPDPAGAAAGVEDEDAPYWRDVLRKAAVIQRASGMGISPGGLFREVEDFLAPQLDWKTLLWRYLVRTPTDFVGFDRRFVGQRLYLDAMDGETVHIYACVDTSGSISEDELSAFLGEIQGILGAYPHLKADLYYADTALDGPHEVRRGGTIPRPKGGGGTSFVPFFAAVEETHDVGTPGVCVYLTDGMGLFPSQVPSLDTLWVVTPGGATPDDFPFGEVARLELLP